MQIRLYGMVNISSYIVVHTAICLATVTPVQKLQRNSRLRPLIRVISNKCFREVWNTVFLNSEKRVTPK